MGLYRELPGKHYERVSGWKAFFIRLFGQRVGYRDCMKAYASGDHFYVIK